MKRILAEVLCRMFVLATWNDIVSTREFIGIAEDAGLDEADLALCRKGVAEYMRLRSRLKQQLTRRGEVEIMKMLAEVDGATAGKLRPDDVSIEVGPFSYNVLVDSKKLSLIHGDVAERDYGMAMVNSDMYPWSFVVRDRAAKLSPKEVVHDLMTGGMLVRRTERHENMHQFYAFLQKNFGVYGYDRTYRRCLAGRMRLNKLLKLNAPELIVQNERMMLRKLRRELPLVEDYASDDWGFIEEAARQEVIEQLCGEIKSELLAFLWSGDFSNLTYRLRKAYLPAWIAQEEKVLGLNLLAEHEILAEIIKKTIYALDVQVAALLESGVSDVDALGQLVAMMNIDRPLHEWGTDKV